MTLEEKTKLVVDTTINLTMKKNDNSLLEGVKRLSDVFKRNAEDEAFQKTVDGMVGFIHWIEDHPKYKKDLLTTLIHDLSEFARNRYENWYCPRSYDYAQFIKE